MADYTYHRGKKLSLDKKEDQFITRALPEELTTMGFDAVEQTSSSSTRVVTSEAALESEMARAREVAPTHHAYTVSETNDDFLITDRIFVRFREPRTPVEVAQFAGTYGLFIAEQYDDREFLFQVLTAAGRNPVKIVVDLTENASDIVELAEHDENIIATTAVHPIPGDPLFDEQWHLHTRRVHNDFDLRSSSLCLDAWDIAGAGSADVVVGVTDDGCRLDHIDFNSPGKFASWGYFVGTRLVKPGDADADPRGMYQSGSNHGTSCAGVIAAESDSELTVGAAPNCRLLPIKWESSGPSLFISPSKLRTAIDYMAGRVDVVSSSWGNRPASRWPAIVTDRIRQLATTGGRRNKGIVFLWAAGNENCPVVHSGNIDIPYTSGWAIANGVRTWVGVKTSRVFENDLVGIPNVMHVAALASNARRSHYSNYGRGVMLCAPSSNSHAYGRMTVRGLGITTAIGDGARFTRSFGGTSSATPLVAGVAALVISANAQLSAPEVIAILKRTAAQNFDTTPYPRTQPTNVDPNPAWDVSPVDAAPFVDIGDPAGTWSPWFGHGRVNARDAVQAAMALLPAAVADAEGTPKLTPVGADRTSIPYAS
jgi:subtilisin family serine protease